MRINDSRVSSTTHTGFDSRVRRTIPKNKAILEAYRLDISNMALRMLNELDDDVAIFNSDVISYNKTLKLSFKYYI